jgi:hypothetical protein
VLPSLWTLLSAPDKVLAQLVAQAMSVYFEHGLVPASRKDGQVYRAVMRVMNMLDDPRSSLLSPSVVARVLPVIAQSLATPRRRSPFPGPTRAEAIAIIERVQHARTSAPATVRPAAARPRRAGKNAPPRAAAPAR